MFLGHHRAAVGTLRPPGARHHSSLSESGPSDYTPSSGSPLEGERDLRPENQRTSSSRHNIHYPLTLSRGKKKKTTVRKQGKYCDPVTVTSGASSP